MFPSDPISTRQLHEAELLVAHQRRTKGSVVSLRTPRWRTPFEAIRRSLRAGPLPSDHELFAGLRRKEFARAGGLFTVVEVPAGRSLGQQGAPVGRFVTILEGRVGVTIDGVPHAVLDDGSQLGALALIDDDRPAHRASFNVMVPSRIAVVDAAHFPAMLEELPNVAVRIRAIVDVRRAYLAGLAAAAGSESASRTPSEVHHFPVHLIDAL